MAEKYTYAQYFSVYSRLTTKAAFQGQSKSKKMLPWVEASDGQVPVGYGKPFDFKILICQHRPVNFRDRKLFTEIGK